MIFIILILIGILHLMTLSQLTFTAWPEMLSYPYLLSKEFIPYKDFIMPYPPGLVFILSAVFNMFGFSPFVLKAFTWVLILLVDLMIFLILRRISESNLIAVIFLLFYIFLQSFLDGNMLWFDFAGVLPLLLGFYFCLNWQKRQNLKFLFFISLFLSLASIIKQINLIYFLIFGLLYCFQRKKIIIKEIIYIILGCLIILIPLIFYVFSINAILEFWNWLIFYPITEWSKFPGYVNFQISKRQMVICILLFSPLFFAALNWKKYIRDKVFLIVLLFFFISLITIYPRFSFFHMQPAIVFLIITLAKIFDKVSQRMKHLYLIAILIIVFLVVIISFKSVVGDKIRFYEKQDLQLSEKISRTVDGQKVFLLGINSSEYVYAGKIPSKNWSDNFGWYLEIPGVQNWVIEGLKNESSKTVFWRVPSKGNWYDLGVYQPKEIVKYIMRNYHKTGNIEKDIEIWKRN